MKNPAPFFIWLVPLAFAVNSWVSFYFPGDEYGLWAFGSLPGVWIVPFLKNSGDIQRFHLPVALGGALSMVLVGWRLDSWKVGKKLWLRCITLLALVLAACFFSLGNKVKVLDVLFGSFGVGLWMGSLLAVLAAFLAKHWVGRPASS